MLNSRVSQRPSRTCTCNTVGGVFECFGFTLFIMKLESLGSSGSNEVFLGGGGRHGHRDPGTGGGGASAVWSRNEPRGPAPSHMNDKLLHDCSPLDAGANLDGGSTSSPIPLWGICAKSETKLPQGNKCFSMSILGEQRGGGGCSKLIDKSRGGRPAVLGLCLLSASGEKLAGMLAE